MCIRIIDIVIAATFASPLVIFGAAARYVLAIQLRRHSVEDAIAGGALASTTWHWLVAALLAFALSLAMGPLHRLVVEPRSRSAVVRVGFILGTAVVATAISAAVYRVAFLVPDAAGVTTDLVRHSPVAIFGPGILSAGAALAQLRRSRPKPNSGRAPGTEG